MPPARYPRAGRRAAGDRAGQDRCPGHVGALSACRVPPAEDRPLSEQYRHRGLPDQAVAGHHQVALSFDRSDCAGAASRSAAGARSRPALGRARYRGPTTVRRSDDARSRHRQAVRQDRCSWTGFYACPRSRPNAIPPGESIGRSLSRPRPASIVARVRASRYPRSELRAVGS